MIGYHVLRDKYLYLQRLYGVRQRFFGILFILGWRSLHSAMAGSIGFNPKKSIKWREQHGKAGDVPERVDQEMVMIRQALSAYSLKDQFNCDETALL